MIRAVILSVHQDIVFDGVERSVVLLAHATRRMQTVVTAPDVRPPFLSKPLLHRYGAEACDVFGFLTSFATEERIVLCMALFCHTTCALRREQEILLTPFQDQGIHEIVFGQSFLADTVAEEELSL